MSEAEMEVLPPVVLHADEQAGLYIHYDGDRAEELRECLEADSVKFTFNPTEAAHLAQPSKAVFVFGRHHPQVVARWLEDIGAEVVFGPEVVLPEDLYHPPVKQLLSLGKVLRAESFNYIARGLSRNDLPQLIRMVGDDQLHDGPEGSPVVWAPIHAWRALTQLGDPEAIPGLVALFRRADDWDEWVSEDLPKALARFGTAVIEPVVGFLANAAHGDWARTAAAKTLGELGQSQPELRLEVIGRLSAQLERFAEQSEDLNAMLVNELWNLKALEAMPAIESAFASGRVDESVVGDLEDVQIHFGLKTQREHPPKPNRLTVLGDRVRAQWQAAGLPLPDKDGNFPEFMLPEYELPDADIEPPVISVPYLAPPKVGRNEPCPCGSGKKYKKCCGR